MHEYRRNHPYRHHELSQTKGFSSQEAGTLFTTEEIDLRKQQERQFGIPIEPRPDKETRKEIRQTLREAGQIFHRNTEQLETDYANFTGRIEHLRSRIAGHIDNTVNDSPYLVGTFLPSFSRTIGIYQGGNAISIEDKDRGIVLQLENNAVNGDIDINIALVDQQAVQVIKARLKSDNQFTLVESLQSSHRDSSQITSSYTISSARDLLLNDESQSGLDDLYQVASLYVPDLLQE